MNYEGCSGAIVLKNYFEVLASYYRGVMKLSNEDGAQQSSHQTTSETPDDHIGTSNKESVCGHSGSISLARICIQQAEKRLLDHLLDYLENRCVKFVRIVKDIGEMKVTYSSNEALIKSSGGHLQRIPIVSFIHANISSRDIVQHCRYHGIICRACKFLSTMRLQDELQINDEIIRLSLAHYNSLDEINECIRVLEMIEGWRE